MKRGMIEKVVPKDGLAKDVLSVVGGIVVAGTTLIVATDKIFEKVLGKKENKEDGTK